MIFDFLFPFGQLGISHLADVDQKSFLATTGLAKTEAAELFEYRKNNNRYWDRPKLIKQVVQKAIPIAEALYPGYSLLFTFDNATSHAIYAKDAFCTAGMNKSSGGNQLLLRDGWFQINNIHYFQQLSFLSDKGLLVPKGIQQILEEKSLWPKAELNLECSKPKCYNCQRMADCKIFVKRSQCQGCRTPVAHGPLCSKNRKCDVCVQQKADCQCVSKKYCATCSAKKEKCMDCEELPPRCTSNGIISCINYE